MNDITDKSSAAGRKARGSGFERRAEILDAAERIFFESGYEGATIRRIAEDVGVSPTALYMHFSDKHSILMEIAGNALDQLIAEAKAIAGGKEDAAVRLRAILKAHMRFALKHKMAYQMVFTEGAREIRADTGDTHEKAVQYYRVLPEVVGELMRDGRVPKGSLHGVSQTLWAGCHGLVNYLINMPGFGWVEVDELMDLMVDGLVKGLIRE